MNQDEGPSIPSRVGSFLWAAATENWGMKGAALVLALIVFIATRDQVTREFTIPLRVIEDPERVLVTTPPESVGIQVRGPWVNLNRLAAEELGSATLDLHDARPGPMALDPAAIVMPRGVILEHLTYDRVDLRFEAVLERRVAIVPSLRGAVGEDYLLGTAQVEPESVIVRGPASLLAKLVQLGTTPVDISGIEATLSQPAEIAQTDPRLTILGLEGSARTVQVRVELIPVIGELSLEIPTGPALREAIPGLQAEIPELEKVSVRGPRGLLRTLEGLEDPLEAAVELDPAGGVGSVTLRFVWSSAVEDEQSEQLSIEPPLIRLHMRPSAPTGE